MRILLANDDGIQSPGLHLLARTAAQLGEVWVVAPAGQCSAMSQRISVFGSIDLYPVPDFPVPHIHAYSISGTPADCVKVALAQVMPVMPDVVLSGINQGFNVGLDILYSGTVGVTMEALANGIPAIAFSSGTGDDLRVTEEYLLPILRDLLYRKCSSYEVWNVNFPSCPPEALRGILEDRFPSSRQFYQNIYTPAPLPQGGSGLALSSRLCTEAEPGSDMDAVLHNHISIGRLCCALLQKTDSKPN